MSEPLVSVVLVTSGRRDMVARALECFERQNYATRELVVVDDPQNPSFDKPVGQRYGRWPGSLGARRNVGMGWARGDLVAHWDSDDWYGPGYLARMIELIESRRAMIAGLRVVPFVDLRTGEWHLYRGPDWFACGATLVYRRRWAMARPFPRVDSGEDAALCWLAWTERVLVTAEADWTFIATIHDHNTSPRAIGGPNWSKLDVREVPKWARKLFA
jgi:glycosyltransferase involved in cell wall biosynthesis